MTVPSILLRRLIGVEFLSIRYPFVMIYIKRIIIDHVCITLGLTLDEDCFIRSQPLIGTFLWLVVTRIDGPLSLLDSINLY